MDQALNTRTIYTRIAAAGHLIFSIALGLFFIYAGVKKFIPKQSRPSNNTEWVKAIEEDRFESPVTFKMGIKALKASGFLLMVGVIQILSGILILIPVTRMLGLMTLLPVTINIFCFHFFMDNRPDENIETGFFLFLNLVLLSFYYYKFKYLLIKNHLIKYIWQ